MCSSDLKSYIFRSRFFGVLASAYPGVTYDGNLLSSAEVENINNNIYTEWSQINK